MYLSDWKLAVSYSKLALGKTPETTRRPPAQSQLKEKTRMMCMNIVHVEERSAPGDKEANVSMLTDYYAFVQTLSDHEPKRLLGLPPQAGSVRNSVSPEKAVEALDKWKKLMDATHNDAKHWSYIRGFVIKQVRSPRPAAPPWLPVGSR